MKTNLLISGILLGAASFISAATNDLTTAIQRGLFEEEANQNLGAAIQAYQSVANQFDKDRKLAATAIFRLGECYRKQGNTNDAATQYERILREFSDQPTLVTLSRQNLATLGSAPAAPAAPVLSDAARQEQKRLLEEEIKLVQKELDDKQELVQKEAFPQQGLLPIERDLLHLKQQVAALDAGLPVSFPATETTAPATSTEADEVRRIQALIKDSPDLINAPDKNGETLLQSAAANGNLAVVKLLLDSGAAVDGLQQRGLTALHYAAANGHKAVVDLLLSKGAKADAQTETGLTPLHLAARKGYEAVAKSLLAAGAPVNAQTSDRSASGKELALARFNPGQTPLHLAAGGGYSGLAQLLLAKGADPNSKDVSDQTPLYLAAIAGYTGLAEMLLAKGANANAEDGIGRTPLSCATRGQHEPMVKLLLAAQANPNAGRLNLPLAVAAYQGDMATLKLLLANGADPNTNSAVNWSSRSYGGGTMCTPLFLAVDQKHADAVAELLRSKADPNVPGLGGTPLLFLALSDPPTLQALLEGGADPNRLDPGGMSPLLRAVQQGLQPAVELLLSHKADPNVRAPQLGWTPLHEAAQRGSKAIAEVLLKAGADVNAKANDGWTPLHMAVSNRQREVAELLLASHADPNAKNNDGQTPLHLAVQSGQRELVELLLTNKADPNERDKVGHTPLDLAKGMAQQPQPMGPGMTRVPPGMAPVFPAQPAVFVATAVREPEAKPETMADLLRRHGALDDLPHLDQIGVRRTAIGASGVILTKGDQDWSQFTLLDLLGLQFGFLASSPNERGDDNYVASGFFSTYHSLPFPDLAHLHISRPTPDLKRWQDQLVDFGPVLESGDCAKDVRLNWGDVVEIPEADHPLNAVWPGFSREELANLKKCLTRQVEIVVKGKATKITLAPQISNVGDKNEAPPNFSGIGPPRGFKGDLTEPLITAHAPFWLRPVLLQSRLVLISSDLSKVKVTRRDPATGQTREWVVDCSKGGDSSPNLWLQDGDRIEVPEKT